MPNWLSLIIIGLILYGVSLAPPVPAAWRPFLQWIGGLLALIGVVLLVLLILHVPLPGATAAAPLLLGFTAPAVPVEDAGAPPRTSYTLRYLLNAGLVLLSILSVVGNFVTTTSTINAAWLGVSDIQWHWLLLIFGAATAINTAISHTPPILNPPTTARLEVEHLVDSLRKTV